MKSFAKVAVVLVAAFTLTAPAVYGAAVPVSMHDAPYFLAQSGVDLKFVSAETGVIKVVNDDTGQISTLSTGAPALPNGYSIRNWPIYTVTGDTSVSLFRVLRNADSQESLWVTDFAAGQWSDWHNLTATFSNIRGISIGRAATGSGKIALVYSVTLQDISKKTFLATNYTGIWATKLLADDALENYDVLYPATPLVLAEQLTVPTPEIDFEIGLGNGYSNFSIQNGKVGLVGTFSAEFAPFTLSGNSFSSRVQYFSQIIDLTTLQPTKRTLSGLPRAAVSGQRSSSEGAMFTRRVGSAWWNTGKSDIGFTVNVSEYTSCPETPNGLNENYFIMGSCAYRESIVQFFNTKSSVVTQVDGIYGDSIDLQLLTAVTDDGLLALASVTRTPSEVNGDGVWIGRLNEKADNGYVWIKASKSGIFPTTTIPVTNSTENAYGYFHDLQIYKGVAMDPGISCNYVDLENGLARCTLKIEFFGEGKRKMFTTSYVNTDNQDEYGDFEAFATGNNISIFHYLYGTDPDTQEYGDWSSVYPNAFTPSIKKSTPTLGKIPTSVKKGKTISLPIKSQQSSSVFYSVSKSSKKICGITSTRVGGTVIKYTLKGLKVGKCTLTAKTSRGFFYKTLNKAVIIQIKK